MRRTEFDKFQFVEVSTRTCWPGPATNWSIAVCRLICRQSITVLVRCLVGCEAAPSGL